MKKTLEQVLKVLIYATFFVPLIVSPSSFIFPFIVPKILVFRSIVEIMLGVYVLLLIINWQEYKPKFTALNLAAAAFFLSFALSTFIGVDPYHSFWDNHERMLGLFTIIHFVLYYFIVTATFKTWNEWKWAMRIFLLAGSVVMFVAFLQTQNPNLLLNQGAARTASTLGNSIYVGGYGLFLVFVAFLLAMREKNNPVWRWTAVVFGILAFLGMFWSGTRGSLLGFVAGAGTAIIGYIIVLKDHKKTRFSLLGILIVGIIAISLLYTFRKTNFVTNLPAVGRAVNTSLSDVMGSPRWIAWEIAVKSWAEKPIFGWGPNNYFYTFNAHYNPRSLDFGYGETWFDNAHNIIVNTLAVQGTVGILTYLAVFIIGIVSLVYAWRKQNLNIHVAVVGSAFLVAHLVGNVTVFENPTSYLYFMFWLAFVCGMSWKGAEQGNNSNSSVSKSSVPTKAVIQPTVDRSIGAGALISVSAVVFLLVFIFNIQPARANMMTLNAIRYLSQDPILGAPAMKTALEFNSPHIDDIRADIGRTTAQVLSSSWQKIGKERSMELYNLAYDNLKKNLILHPLDIRNQLTLSQLAQLAATINQDGKYMLDSKAMLEDALQKSPRRQQIIYGLSGILLQFGSRDEAVKLLEGAITSNPKIAESYWRLAYTYKLNNDVVKMRETLDLAAKNGVQFSEQENGIIQQILGTPTTSTATYDKSKK